MIKIQSDYSLTYLFISHDLSVIKHVSHRIAVMYAGQLVELSKNKELFANPFHPYTRALLSAIAVPDPGKKERK
jgi:oligopeptide transport system ATP-binding protein